MKEHGSSRTAYIATFVLLMLLVAATVAVAHLHLGRWALPAALAIAAIKVTGIGIVFMHLWEEPPLIKLIAGSGLFWLGILFVLAACDYLTRNTVIPAHPEHQNAFQRSLDPDGT